jgi:hypothetical protein
MGRDGGIALIDPLLTDAADQPLDRLGPDFQAAQLGQAVAGGAVRFRPNPGVDDLPLDSRAGGGAVKPQGSVLRGKKPADSGGNGSSARSRSPGPGWS